MWIAVVGSIFGGFKIWEDSMTLEKKKKKNRK